MFYKDSELHRAIPKIIFVVAAEILALSVFLPWSGDEPLILLLFAKDVQWAVKILGIFTIGLVYLSSIAFFTLEPSFTIIGLFTAGMGITLYVPIALHHDISFGFELAIVLLIFLSLLHTTHISKPPEAEIYTLSRRSYNIVRGLGFAGVVLTLIFMYVGIEIVQNPTGQYLIYDEKVCLVNNFIYYIILGIILILIMNASLIAIIANRKYSYYASIGLFFASTLTCFIYALTSISVFRIASIGMVLLSSFIIGITRSVPFPPKDYLPSFLHY